MLNLDAVVTVKATEIKKMLVVIAGIVIVIVRAIAIVTVTVLLAVAVVVIVIAKNTTR